LTDSSKQMQTEGRSFGRYKQRKQRNRLRLFTSV